MIANNNLFIRIPNIIADDTKVPPTAKYLYGIIDMLSYISSTTTIEELCEYSQITRNTLLKHLQLLKTLGYIDKHKTKNGIKVTPLINKDLEIIHREDKIETNKINNEIERKLALKRLVQQINMMDRDKENIKNDGIPLAVKQWILSLK